MILVNGQKINQEKGLTLDNFLSQQGYLVNQIAVECNGAIVPKCQYDQVLLSDGDTLEIVHFVGGG